MPTPNTILKQGCLFFIFYGIAISLTGQSTASGPLAYDEGAKTGYRAYCDASSIHVRLTIRDAAQQRKMIMNGLELWIDEKGKKNKKTGLTYPLADEERSPMDPHASTDSAARLQKMISALSSKKQIKAVGFAKQYNGLRNSQDTSGPVANAFFAGDTLIYEASIPFGSLNKPISPGSSISIGIVENGIMPMNSGADDMGGPPGNEQGPPPGGSPPGGGPPPGDMPPDAQAMQNIFQENAFWFPLKIANQN